MYADAYAYTIVGHEDMTDSDRSARSGDRSAGAGIWGGGEAARGLEADRRGYG